MEKDKTVENLENQDIENNDAEVEEKAVIDDNKDENNDEISKENEIEENTIEDELKQKYEDILDKYQRLMAEFENYRKRNEKEKQEMFDMGMVSSITRFLPVVDNFERGIAQIDEEAKKDAINDGFIKVYDQIIQILEAMDVHPIEALDKEFDPNLHNAVMHDEDSEKPANIIAEEFQKGYKYKEKVIRYSMVKVLN